VAKETADILRNLIGTLRFTTLQELLNAVTETGKRLIAAQPLGKNRRNSLLLFHTSSFLLLFCFDLFSSLILFLVLFYFILPFLEFVIGNIVRRLLRICREEYRMITKKTTPALSQFGPSHTTDQEATQPIENTGFFFPSL
jgi:hypothetical protein